MAEAEIEYRSAAVNSDIAVEFVAGIVVESAVLFVSEIPADIAAGTAVGNQLEKGCQMAANQLAARQNLPALRENFLALHR